MTFADGACEVRSRSEEKAMQGHRRRRATQRSPATPISPKGGGGTASISLSLLLHDVTDIASSSLRELEAVALATNVTVFMKRDTEVPPTFNSITVWCERRDTLKKWQGAPECGRHLRCRVRIPTSRSESFKGVMSRPRNTLTFVASATASSSRSDDDAMSVHRGGGATKKSMPSRRHPSG